jgi:uncharacterized protein YdhG (YjbR/CyaY superfamily)
MSVAPNSAKSVHKAVARRPPAYKSVEEYLARQPEAVKSALQRVRAAIRQALPAALEAISYQMPTYRLNGRVVLYFAGWKEHYALYPGGTTGRIAAAFESERDGCEIDKGTIRFPLSRPVPVRLIGKIAKFRAQEAAVSVTRKAAGKGTKAAVSRRAP